MNRPLKVFTIYNSPSDFPGEYVLRQWSIDAFGKVQPGQLMARGRSLGDVRAELPGGLFNLGRESRDAPAIVETWV